MDRSSANLSLKRFQSAHQRGAPPCAILAVGLILAFLIPLLPKQTPAGTGLFHAPPLPAVFTLFRDPALFTDHDLTSDDIEFTRADCPVPCDGMPCRRQTKLQPLSPPRTPDPQSDRNNPKPDGACWVCSPFRFSLLCRIESARPLGLRGTFLRISTGEWAPLPRSFTGNRRYLGAVRSFLHLRGDLERMCTRAA